uniref:GPI-anchored protein LLG1-like domain-containing protein n=1 Tax=Rhizophora mucronata TaxID=61149 RepID=A0A2P2PW98_RHIMU
MDYSIITKKCKGPTYPAEQCCTALKEFACPVRDAINDMESDCASTMFSYINLYGKYPPGLFANECKEDKNGLDCEQLEKRSSSGVDIATTPSSALMLATAILALFVQIF